MEIYGTRTWKSTRQRALARDGNRCTVSRLLGGRCSDDLEAHHIVALADGGAPFELDNVGTACSIHHPMWEALRRQLVKSMLAAAIPVRCPHTHRSAAARRLCEARLARRREHELVRAA